MYAVVGTNVCILSEKTKFQVNFFNIFPKSTQNTFGVIFACPLRPVSGGGQSVWGVCKNCTPGVRVSAMPASGPCSRIRYPGSGRPQWLVPAFCRRQCLLSGLPAAAVGSHDHWRRRRPAILLRPLSGISCFGCRPVTLHWPLSGISCFGRRPVTLHWSLSGISCFGCRRRPIPGAALPCPAGAPEMYTLKLVLLTYPPLSAFIVSVFLLFLLADGHT